MKFGENAGPRQIGMLGETLIACDIRAVLSENWAPCVRKELLRKTGFKPLVGMDTPARKGDRKTLSTAHSPCVSPRIGSPWPKGAWQLPFPPRVGEE